MSAKPLPLEDFSAESAAPQLDVIDGDRLEEARLAAYDKGYAAGWDDGADAVRSEHAGTDDEVRARLQDLSFTYHEARAHVMRSLTPLLRAMAETAVPTILHETLGARLASEMEQMAKEHADDPVEILTAPADREPLETAIGGAMQIPIEIVGDEALVPGVVQLRLGASERKIDTGALQRRLADALDALDSHNAETLSHGR